MYLSMPFHPSLASGTDIYVYGAASGPVLIDLDGDLTTLSASIQSNATSPHLLYSAHNLTNSTTHSLLMTNLGAADGQAGDQMLLDYIQTTVQLAPEG